MIYMSKFHFNKPATTIQEQIALLQKRGMNIQDKDQAAFYLKHINYYRLRAYWIIFEDNKVSHRFMGGTNFNRVIELYDFDRKLRLVLLDALERIETSIRASWAHYMAYQHGSYSYQDSNLVTDQYKYKKDLKELNTQINRAHEVFIKHFKEKYYEESPPIWALSEVVSFGLLSRLYNNLRPMATRSAIAKVYLISEQLLGSWLEHLTLIRNICAHHSRLWNKQFTKTPMPPKSKNNILYSEFVPNSRKLYNTLVIILYMMDIVTPHHHIRQKLKALLKNPAIIKSDMGFPEDWEERRIWSEMLYR